MVSRYQKKIYEAKLSVPEGFLGLGKNKKKSY